MKDIKGKILSIAILRCLATALITNTHFNDVWPSESLAVGGLLGDVLFFMISGYCLINSKSLNFFSWYFKRILRIYPAIILMTCFNLAVGYFTMSEMNLFSAFIYPTFYAFVGAIMLLYIPFYFYRKLVGLKKSDDGISQEIKARRDSFLNNKSLIGFIAIFVIYMIAYLLIVDKSEYRMNAVSHPITLFLYFTAMVAGAALKKIGFLYKKNNKCLWVLACVLASIGYALLITYVRGHEWTFKYQIVVNIVLLIAAVLVFKAVFLFEDSFKRILYPNGATDTWQSKCIWKLSELTLDIYVVQHVIINYLQGIVFPINLLLIVPSIIVAALFVNYLTDKFRDAVNRVLRIS